MEGSRRPMCVIVSNIMAIGHTVAEIWRFFDFSKMTAVGHLRFVTRVFGPPRKGIWWSLSLCKVWLESISSFDNMSVLIFCKLGLKTPIHVPKIGFLSERGQLCHPYNTMWHHDPSNCLATTHNVTDRTDNGLGRTDLETVDQKFNDFWRTYVHECIDNASRGAMTMLSP